MILLQPRLVATLIMVAIVVVAACQRSKQALTQPTVATIDGASLTTQELQKFLNMEINKYPAKVLENRKKFSALRRQILANLIERRVLLMEASRRDVRLSQEELSLATQELKEGYSDREFARILEEQKFTTNEWMDLVHDQKTIEKLLAQEVLSKVEASDQEISDTYASHQGDFFVPEAVRARQIVTDTYEKALHILEKIIKGQNFAKAALDHSLSPDRAKGGDLGFFTRGTYPKEFEDTCFRLKVGEISEIVKSPYGYHIFKLMEHREARQLLLEEVREKIRAIVIGNKGEATIKEWKKNLIKGYIITIDEDELKKIKPLQKPWSSDE